MVVGQIRGGGLVDDWRGPWPTTQDMTGGTLGALDGPVGSTPPGLFVDPSGGEMSRLDRIVRSCWGDRRCRAYASVESSVPCPVKSGTVSQERSSNSGSPDLQARSVQRRS